MLADNSITVNALARKAHQEIINAKQVKIKQKKDKFQKKSQIILKPNVKIKKEVTKSGKKEGKISNMSGNTAFLFYFEQI